MSEIDYDQRDPFDDPDDEDHPFAPPTCNRCGKEGLAWVFTGIRWRLVEGTAFHRCAPSPDDFEVLPTPTPCATPRHKKPSR